DLPRLDAPEPGRRRGWPARLVSDDEPCSPGRDASAGGLSVRAVAAGPRAVRTILQCAVRAQRAPLAEPVFRMLAGAGSPVVGPGVCGAESGAGGTGGLGGQLSLVKRWGAPRRT